MKSSHSTKWIEWSHQTRNLFDVTRINRLKSFENNWLSFCYVKTLSPDFQLTELVPHTERWKTVETAHHVITYICKYLFLPKWYFSLNGTIISFSHTCMHSIIQSVNVSTTLIENSIWTPSFFTNSTRFFFSLSSYSFHLFPHSDSPFSIHHQYTLSAATTYSCKIVTRTLPLSSFFISRLFSFAFFRWCSPQQQQWNDILKKTWMKTHYISIFQFNNSIQKNSIVLFQRNFMINVHRTIWLQSSTLNDRINIDNHMMFLFTCYKLFSLFFNS